MAGPSRPDDEHPLDELFIVGAKYHEPSAAERARAARDAEKRARDAEKERKKRVRHTKRVLGGGDDRRGMRGEPHEGYDKRTALIGFAVLVVLAVLFAQTPWG